VKFAGSQPSRRASRNRERLTSLSPNESLKLTKARNSPHRRQRSRSRLRSLTQALGRVGIQATLVCGGWRLAVSDALGARIASGGEVARPGIRLSGSRGARAAGWRRPASGGAGTGAASTGARCRGGRCPMRAPRAPRRLVSRRRLGWRSALRCRTLPPSARRRAGAPCRPRPNESLQLTEARGAPRGGIDHACASAAELQR